MSVLALSRRAIALPIVAAAILSPGLAAAQGSDPLPGPPGQFPSSGQPGQFQQPGGGQSGQFQPNGQPGQFQPKGQPGQPAPSGGQEPSPFDDLGAGGLRPPAPGDPTPKREPTETERRLDATKQADKGRGLSWVYVDVGGGFEHVGLQTIDDGDGAFAGSNFIETTGTGGHLSAGLGARLFLLTVGARGRFGFFESFDLARVGGEVGLRIPLGRIEPRFDLGLGYASLLSAYGGVPVDAHIEGLYGRTGAGVDLFMTKKLALGFGASWDLLVLSRPALSAGDIAALGATGTTAEAQLGSDATGVGSSVALSITLGLHL